MIRTLAILACLLTVCITGASAFIRHTQAGVGCDGRPECLQQIADAGASGAGLHAASASGAGAANAASASVRQARAVVIARTLHRVSASVVGLLAIGLLVFGWNGLPRSGRVAAVSALLISAFLAWLGRYTPHPVPWVTIGNVGGGFALVAAFACVAAGARRQRFASPDSALDRRNESAGSPLEQRNGGRDSAREPRFLRPHYAGFAIGAGVLLAILLWVGLMIGARDAVSVCPTALCLDGARFEFSAFDPALAQASIAPGSGQGLHLVHRVVALAFTAVVLVLAWRMWLGGRRRLAVLVAAMLAVQITLGLATAGGANALASATLHNVVAALWAALLAALATRPSSPPPASQSPLAGSSVGELGV